MIEQYKKAVKIARMGLWDWEVLTNKTFWSDEKFELFGFEPNEFELTTENAFKTVHPDDSQMIFDILDKKLPTENYFDYEYRGVKKNGKIIDIWVRVNVERNEMGEAIKVYGISQDISNRKKLENDIKTLNEDLEERVQKRTKELESKIKENELLIKEIHHRVKNNLQVISSLLSLQSSSIQQESLKLLFKNAQNRIYSISLIHEMLYQNENFTEINYKEYINKLLPVIVTSAKGTVNNIKLSIKLKEIYFNLNTSVPLSLLINEIVTNSIKHGIDDVGLISLKLEKTKKQGYLLKLGDDGRGSNFDITNDKTNTLGLRLVKNLVGQLHGKIERDYSLKGTHYNIYFEESKI